MQRKYQHLTWTFPKKKPIYVVFWKNVTNFLESILKRFFVIHSYTCFSGKNYFFQNNYIKEWKNVYQQNNDIRGVSSYYFNVSDFLTWISYRLIIPLVIVAIEQGNFPNREFLCFFVGTEHFFSKLPYKSKKNIPCQKYGLVKWK